MNVLNMFLAVVWGGVIIIVCVLLKRNEIPDPCVLCDRRPAKRGGFLLCEDCAQRFGGGADVGRIESKD